MTKIKSVEEQANYFRGGANIVRAKMMLKEDRLSHKEAIVGALEIKRKPESYTNMATLIVDHNAIEYNKAIDQAIAIVNSIYKDSE